MARTASGFKRLVGMVNGRIVASQASLIADLRGEVAGASNVTQTALLRKHRMRRGQRSAGIDFLSALRPLRNEPPQGNHRNRDREPESPASKDVRTREILQVNALGEFLGCS
jgi:hypothetical protein